MRVLLVDGDDASRTALERALVRSGLRTDAVAALPPGTLPGREGYDVLVIALRPPSAALLDVLGRLRRQRDDVPVLVLTGRDALAERIACLENGADDCLARPFAFEELLARLRALARRRRGELVPEIRMGRLIYLPGSGDILLDGRAVPFPWREQATLELLMRRAGRVVPRQLLIERLWGGETEVGPGALEAHVSRLRRRLRRLGAGVEIRPVRGIGYMLHEAEADQPLAA